MESVHLTVAEDVKNAGYAMQSALPTREQEF